MPTFLPSSPSYFQQATRTDVSCNGESATSSGVSLLIISDAGDDGGYGSPWLKDPTIRKIIINLSIPFLGA
jgi:N-acetylmuramic acid 6-phosphate (MurNAc-6-P) etherase